MKEQNYKEHIKGIKLDKIQEGKFIYERSDYKETLSNFARKLRKQVKEMENGARATRIS